MTNLTLSAPALFADHHVLRVRKALLALEGVEDVCASSAWQAVIVSYDENRIEPTAIEKALIGAGYGPDETTPVLAQGGAQFQDPSWEALSARVTETDESDLKMSGEFRKY